MSSKFALLFVVFKSGIERVNLLRWAEGGWGGGGSKRGGGGADRSIYIREEQRLEERGRGVVGKREFSWVSEIKRVGHGGWGGGREREVDRQMQVQLDQRDKERREW